MCKYCNLVSGDLKSLKTENLWNLRIERHNNSYSLIASVIEDDIEIDINYCPMCRKKVRRLRCGIYHFVVIKNVKIKNVKEIKIIITLC